MKQSRSIRRSKRRELSKWKGYKLAATNTSQPMKLRVQQRFIELYNLADRPFIVKEIVVQICKEFGEPFQMSTGPGKSTLGFAATVYAWTRELREHRSVTNKGPFMGDNTGPHQRYVSQEEKMPPTPQLKDLLTKEIKGNDYTMPESTKRVVPHDTEHSYHVTMSNVVLLVFADSLAEAAMEADKGELISPGEVVKAIKVNYEHFSDTRD